MASAWLMYGPRGLSSPRVLARAKTLEFKTPTRHETARASEEDTLLPETEEGTLLPAPEEDTLLPAPEEDTLLPAPEQGTLLPAPEQGTLLPAPEAPEQSAIALATVSNFVTRTVPPHNDRTSPCLRRMCSTFPPAAC